MVLFFLFSSPALAVSRDIQKPITPVKPRVSFEKPTPPPLPEFPDRSGLYSDPQDESVFVRVFVHKDAKGVSQLAVCEDPASSAVIDPAGWKLPNNKWTYQLNVSSTPSSIGRTNLPTLVSNTLITWDQPLISAVAKPTLVRGSNVSTDRSRNDGKNVIAWGSTSGSALGVTYIRYYPSTGLVVDVDTILNKRVKWTWQPTTCGFNAYEAQEILTHEIGHWYGLDDEYTAEYVNNTMYGYASKGESKKCTLTEGDAQALQSLYP